MQTENTGTTTVITPRPNLSTLGKDQLIDLLQHMTKLLLIASNTHLPDRPYIESLRKEVQAIQKEIKDRAQQSSGIYRV